LLVMQYLFLQLHLAFAHQGGRPPFAERVDRGMHNGHANGRGKTYRLRQPGFRRALPTHIANGAARWLLERKDNSGAGGVPDARLTLRRQKSPHAAR
jgi:hypothetical protein